MEIDPTPNLKSSPEAITFIPFNNDEITCPRCITPYSKTLIYDQKYCKECMLWYINAAGDDSILDVYLVPNPNSSQIYYTQDIKEWRQGCSEVLYFRQVSPGECTKP